MFNIHVDTSGPVFDGRAEQASEEFTSRAAWEIAKEGRGDLGVRFIEKFKHPTGYYEAHVEPTWPVILGPGRFQSTIHDNRVVYGPWLEGVGSRNYPVTRFKGYRSFMYVAILLRRKAAAIAERHLPRFLARMNGGA